MQDLLIHTPDGKTRTLELNQDRFGLGRSSQNELCYPEDAGLSRLHLVLERTPAGWSVRDLGSKNGTQVNGVRIQGLHALTQSDRIAAGHLTIEFLDKRGSSSDRTVMFVDANGPTAVPSTVATSLVSAKSDEIDLEGGPQMRALIKIGRELSGNMTLPVLFRQIMDLTIDAVGASRGVLMTIENDELEVRAAKGEGFRISTTVRDRVLKERESLLIRDARLDQALAGRMSIVEQQIRSILAVPLQTEKRMIGLLYLDSPHFVHEFTKADLNLLTVMANVAAIRIEHARLAEVEQAERLMSKELEQAAEIQRGLLPTAAPVLPGIDLAGYNAPCRTVGGDYFDFFAYDNGRVAMLVADVAGKGMPAAMLMSNLQARVQVLFDDPSEPAELITRLNRVVAKNCPSNRFISLFLGIYDTKSGEMTYCNAGHNPPLLVRRDGTVEELESTGVILGILPAARYDQKKCRLGVGDIVVLFSDGVTEACPPESDDQFGEARLAQLLTETKCTTAQAICESIQQRLTEWMGAAPPADDITLVVARRTA